jgi:hypothetical protein
MRRGIAAASLIRKIETRRLNMEEAKALCFLQMPSDRSIMQTVNDKDPMLVKVGRARSGP